MKKYMMGILVVCLLPLMLKAQVLTTVAPADTLWKKSFSFGINFNQASFSGNWFGGGVNSIALSSLLNAQARYKKDKWSWDNQADFLYGVINNNGQGYRKSQDRIYLDSKVGYDISEFWNAFFSANFLTQFAPGYRYVDLPTGGEDALKISDFLAPGFLTFSIGFEYVPNDNFSLRLSPFSPRFTFVTDTELYLNTENNTNYGVEIGETLRTEWLAAQIVAEWNKNITETISLQTRYMLFANYENLNFEEIDHRLDVMLNAKLTNYINLSLSGIMIYDYDQVDEIQVSQLLGIGILFQAEGAVVK
ncbi:DUF3078 domain-containing protein [Catalinimonas niigatensis]|uniref:DUF3078 domain-containing protein n=1 Tax=Catalinimonas niigatensis TaxID=1397264 RepID=UPI00266622F5|nr:DUF3078 domain-containing protein [Catalinimonas niigatensis]WPP53223.1 DUF3078 domain-containing protein [Catalinimonas niigatensis]